MADLATLQEQVRFGARTLQRKLGDIWGHCTVRLPPEYGREGFILAYLRIPVKPTPPDQLYYFDYDGKLLEGQGQVPWEVPLFTNVFRARPDIQSVVHVHPPLAVTLSVTGETVKAIHQLSVRFGTGAPTFKGDLITTQELGAGLADALGQERAVLLNGHGAVTVGNDVPDAVATALVMEETARMQLMAAAAGKVIPLPAEILQGAVAQQAASSAQYIWRFLEWEEESGAVPRYR
jgi:ribulose-5-phosphate 4-epimerase/fuculose-1-phosphate aldolase